MIYDPSAAPASQAGSSTTDTTPEATEACEAETQSSEPMKAPQAVKRTVIQREIGPKKYRGVLLGVPKKVKAKCLQCDVPLCVHGGCWDICYDSKKFS
jgi:hypothetical protein